MNGELLTALERIEREKGISKEILFSAIESALVSAARKVIDDPEISKEDITVTMDQETGEITVFSEGEVVENERFGRIAAQTAKQVIIQKIREAERDVIFDKYEKKVGMIVSGSVHRFEKGNVIVELDDAEALLPKSGQIPRERFRQGEQIRAYLLKVERSTSGPEIILSRTDAGFVKKLFELEVPEISQGIVEIKSVAREAGERTKIAVSSKEEKVDPVGACVGMRGSRVRDIVKELHGERIDIVRWDNDIRTYLKAAVSPAEISQMVVDRENKTITLVVAQDQLSLLIGKKGRNIRLASRLLGWELVAESTEVVWEIPISEVQGIGEKTLKTLEEAGFDSVEKVQQSGVEGLLELDGIGQKTAEKIIAACEEAAAQVAAQEAEEAAAQGVEFVEEEETVEPQEEEPAEEEDVTGKEAGEGEAEETEEEPGTEDVPEEEVSDEETGSGEEPSGEEEDSEEEEK